MRKFPNGLSKGEKWIADALTDKIQLLLPNVDLYMERRDHSNSPYIILSGWLENPSKAGSVLTHTLKEVIVWHHPPVINIYNVVEHGRRHFRILEYTSNMSLCLHEVKGEPYPDRVAGILSLSSGVPMTTVIPEASVIISRALNNKLGNQVFIPDRFLGGILPTALVEKYDFWQSDDDCLYGYEVSDDDAMSTGPPTQLKVTLTKTSADDKSGFCNSDANAIIQRIPVVDLDPSSKLDHNRQVFTLLNIMCAPPHSLLKKIGMLLSRLDNLSHVLVWSKSDVKSPNESCIIDRIELPRVNLTFNSRKIENIDGKVEHRLYSNDHDGLYIAMSMESRQVAEKLLGGIAHFIVLRNDDNDLFVLMPGCALPRRLHVDGAHLSVQILLDRRNKEWIENMSEIRCYLYPIHTSRAFLFTPSLASSMYLLLLHFICGTYSEVFKMIESCVSEQLTDEEVRIC